MSLDLKQFHEAFFAESSEALDSMEAALLKLNAGEVDNEIINTIFRVAHSIKGGSATFGFSNVASFTHTLETLLDQLRSGTRSVDCALVDVLLRSSDVMREMISALQEQRCADEHKAAAVHAELDALLKEHGAAPRSKPQPCAPVAAAAVAAPAAGVAKRGWHIRLAPGPDMLRRGNDPLRLIRELRTLGELTVRVDAGGVPTLSELDPEVCVLAWDMQLFGSIERSVVEQVFEWAVSECTLQIDPLSPPEAEQLAAPAAEAPAAAPADPAAKPARAEKADPARAASAESASIRVSIQKIDELLNAVGELVITQSVLSQLAAPLEGRPAEELRGALAQLERHMRSLQESVMRVRMVPISFVFSRFPRMIRDLGQRLGKKLELKLTGEQTELDKTVLEKIGDPLVHLVRNSIDHGIEMPEKRLAAGKPETGTIHLHAYHKGGDVVVEVSDDGGGLNKNKIQAKARERGLIAADEELTEERIFNLIFAPGFSTADAVSDVSGRGVGMDVVRGNINELGGQVQILSRPGQGSTVRIRLPLTLAILDGQLVRVGSEVYVVPIVCILETIQVRQEQINSIADKAQVFRLRDDYLPIVKLYEVFGIQTDHTDLVNGLLMILEADGKRIGLFVDELMSQQQVVIKSLEANFRQVTGLSGATMLGDGRVALIIDVPGLISIFQQQGPRRPAALEAA